MCGFLYNFEIIRYWTPYCSDGGQRSWKNASVNLKPCLENMKATPIAIYTTKQGEHHHKKEDWGEYLG